MNLRHFNEEIKPELLNNIGVLKMKTEKYEESLNSFQRAYDICLKSEETRIENGTCKVQIFRFFQKFFDFFNKKQKKFSLYKVPNAYYPIQHGNPF